MVYRGKPSAACAECRKRRSRCDQIAPACGQCTKAGRICSGYRNTVDLMFLDESMDVVNKNKKGGRFRPGSSQVYNDGTIERIATRAARSSPLRLTDFVMYQSTDDLGINFFMSNFVGDDPAVSQIYYLPRFYANYGYTSIVLQQSITAAGLAGFAKTARRRTMAEQATRSYITAVGGINAALSDPIMVARDSTLMSIIMAAMFEMQIMPGEQGMQNCTKHLAGAVTVAHRTIKQERQTAITQQILTSLVQCVIINCWIQQVPLPPGFIELREEVNRKINPQSAHGSFLDIIMELVRFRHDLQDGKYESSMSIIAQAKIIDDMLVVFARDMPPNKRFDIIWLADEEVAELAYNGYYHVYPQRFTAHLWNNVRSSRFRLHQVIIRQCHIMRSTYQSPDYCFLSMQEDESKAQITAMAGEILATVPQLVGYLTELQKYSIPMSQASPVRSPSQTPLTSPVESYRTSTSTKARVESSPHHIYGVRSGDSTSLENSPKSTTSGFSDLEMSPVRSQSRPASLYHVLFQLYSIASISHIPASMQSWVLNQIKYFEDIADAKDLARLKAIVRKRPGDGFPVDKNEGSTGSPPEPVTLDSSNRSVWLSVCNWFSVGWEKMGNQGSNEEKWDS